MAASAPSPGLGNGPFAVRAADILDSGGRQPLALGLTVFLCPRRPSREAAGQRPGAFHPQLSGWRRPEGSAFQRCPSPLGVDGRARSNPFLAPPCAAAKYVR